MFFLDVPPTPTAEAPVLVAQADYGVGRDVVMQDLTPHTDEAAPTMLAAAPTSTITDAGVASVSVAEATSKTKYDAVLSVCGPMHSADQAPANIERDNVVDPISNVAIYLQRRGILINGISGPGEFDPNQFKIKVLKSPAHGELGDSIYHANAGYLGIDQIVFDVEVVGKKLKVIETLVIHNSGNLDYPTDAAKAAFDKACPKDKGSSLDIIELPTDGFVPDDELAKLHSMVSFALGSGSLGNGGLSFADLPGGAVGQTNANGITLDPTASGYNWFIDPTPTDNSEFLPTSNPDEWVAKAGSAAYGKMDMLSVLLHEYGHALGIEHSANSHDFMGTTLTPGVRRLPSADEMALMQQLISQAKEGLASNNTQDNAPTFPTLPLGGSFGLAFLGRLRSSRYGGVSIVPDPSTLVTQYAVAANATFINLDTAAGWNTQGSVDINPLTSSGPSTGSGQSGMASATLNEVSGSQTRLSQVFMLNDKDRYLSFTLSGAVLDNLTGAPDDAFEVALLDANTGLSVLGGDGLTRTDAFLNLQADGTERKAQGVTRIDNPDGSRTYRVDLSGVAKNTAVNLSFDLLGFGASNSHVTVSDVRLSGLPQLRDEVASIAEDNLLTFDPYTQADSQLKPLLASHVVDAPTHGAVAVNTDGTFSYTPDLNYFGSDSFSYRLSDGSLDSNLATVSLTVTPVNDAPVVADVQATTAEDTPLVIALGAYASDVDSATLTTQIVAGPAHGVLAQNMDGTYSYTPDANYNGADSFTYKANDGALDSNIATVSLNVTAVNDAPTLGDLNLAAVEDTALPMNLLAAASDIDSTVLTAAIVAGAQHGQVSVNANGSFTYTPDANYNGADSFTYRVNDGALDSNVATVNLSIAAVNDAPVAADAAVTTATQTCIRFILY